MPFSTTRLAVNTRVIVYQRVSWGEGASELGGGCIGKRGAAELVDVGLKQFCTG